MPWIYNPHVGGKKVPTQVRLRTDQRIQTHAQRNYAGRFARIEVRFHGALCYVDAFVEPEEPTAALLRTFGETREQFLARRRAHPLHLYRLRFFGDEDRWTMAFYTYSNEKYEPCMFDTGGDHGTPEEALDVASVYLPEARPSKRAKP